MTTMRVLFSFAGTIDRRAYVIVALVCVLVKHALDLSLATFVFDRPWGPLNYLVPLGAPVPLHAMSGADAAFIGWMLIASIPFAWVGLAITAKRFRTIGWPGWTVLLFFVPIANIVSFGVAALWPERTESRDRATPGWLARWVPQDRFGIAVVAAIVPAAFGLILVAVSTELLDSYGWALFAAVPFAQGALAVILYASHGRRGIGASVLIALISCGVSLFGLLAVALEGVVCIAMAAPIALVMAWRADCSATS